MPHPRRRFVLGQDAKTFPLQDDSGDVIQTTAIPSVACHVMMNAQTFGEQSWVVVFEDLVLLLQHEFSSPFCTYCIDGFEISCVEILFDAVSETASPCL